MKFHFSHEALEERELLHLLKFIESSYNPRLSEQVDLGAYAAKLSTAAHIKYVIADDVHVGLIAYYLSDGAAYISSFGLHNNYHGYGIGRSMMETFINDMKKLGIQKISLDVHHVNEKARKFYAHFGFIPEDSNSNTILLTKEIKY